MAFLRPYPVAVLCVLVVYALFWGATPVRVGDGSEYYAMFLSWAETRRPWMTPPAFDAYERLVASNQISYMVPRNWLEGVFPALRLNEQADFNHFWFYSLLAYLAAAGLGSFGVPVGVHQGFLLLHLGLLLASLAMAARLLGTRGVLAVAVLTLSSPIIWYLDKVHTELFTYCTVLMAVIALMRDRYLVAALCLALASTQNPSFALLAAVPYGYRFVVLGRRRFSWLETVLAVATALIVLAHPVYYFLRFGVPTPQMLAGGASVGANLAYLHIWLLDPDIGLLPNWPLGVLMVMIGAGALWPLRFRLARPSFLLVFAALFFAVNLLAHASTTNLNSGATPGPARYALWYIPIFLPLVVAAFGRMTPLRRKWPLWGLVLTLTVVNLSVSWPARPENNYAPTFLSRFVQTYLSALYTPPAEVFAERFSGLGEGSRLPYARAIVGPDCRKALVYPQSVRFLVTIPASCGIADSQVLAFLHKQPLPDGGPVFLRLPDDLARPNAP